MIILIINLCSILITFIISCNGQQTLRLIPVKELSRGDGIIYKDNIFLTPYWDNFEGPQPSLDLSNFDVTDLAVYPFCPISKEGCSEKEYRRIDGFCNNKNVPTYGASGDIFARLLPPIYDYGFMRIKSSNGLLPSPRIVSNSMKSMRRRMDPKDVNILWLFFGQFLDHDMTLTPLALERKDMSVCENCSSWRTNVACAPILIPKDDDAIPSAFPNGERKCIPFVRSNAIPSVYQNKPALDQLNFNTAFIDLSLVYGSDSCTERELRLFRFGQLLELKHPFSLKGMLPTKPIEPYRDCRSTSGRCPKAGDQRAIENLGIHLIHVMFLREHNRIARKLYEINSHWDDERLFQEARRINIAQYQKIVYEEFLPILLGKNLMKSYNLYPLSKRAYFKDYNPSVSPQILTEFATATFRVGHTMIPDHFIQLNEYYLPLGSIPLESSFRNDSFIYNENFLDNMARGMAATKVEAVDPVIQKSLTDKLFIKNKDVFTSQDLISLNIARARDHGIPGYTAYRHVCRLSPINSWTDMKIFQQDLKILQNIYSSVHDVDLFVGGLAELPQEDSIIGTTFGCIAAQQFLRLKTGDHFWFENRQNRLTLDQIQEIKEGSGMLRILFLNLESTLYLPKKVFYVPDKDKQRNPLVSSAIVQDINFRLWKEEKGLPNAFCVYKDKNHRKYEKISISPCLNCSCNESIKVSCEWNYENCSNFRDDPYCKIVC